MNDIPSLLRYAGLHPGFAEEIAYFFQNRVYSVQIESTLACRQGCRYCYVSSDNPPQKELPADGIRTMLDSAVRMGVRAIDWLGGDPVLRDDWYNLMAYSRDIGLTNNIWSSGLPFNDRGVVERAVEVTRGGFISVHLDSLDEKVYGELHTGNPARKIRALLSAVDNLQEYGKASDQMINCITLTKPVAGEDVRRTIRYFWEEKGMRTCLTLLAAAGSALRYPHWQPSSREIQEAYEFRNAINFPNTSLSLGPMDVSKYYCGGTICVTVDGDITPCSVIRKGFGNIFQESPEEILAGSREELLFTPLRIAGACGGFCTRCNRGTVCWGCRASAYYSSGDMLSEDPNCWMNPHCDSVWETGEYDEKTGHNDRRCD